MDYSDFAIADEKPKGAKGMDDFKKMTDRKV